VWRCNKQLASLAAHACFALLLTIPLLSACIFVGQEIALRTPGFAGADLANLLNEAAILAGRKSLPGIRLQEIDEAVDRWVY
jgi:hypothetical protein